MRFFLARSFILLISFSWAIFPSCPALDASEDPADPSDARTVGPTLSPSEYLDKVERGEEAPEAPPSPPSVDAFTISPDAPYGELTKEEGSTPSGGRVKMSGHYRLAMGVDSEDVIVNDANADLQERNFRYLFGERLNNTYDPAIYQQYLLNIDFSPREKFDFYAQLVADPWSWVGTTGEQEIRNNGDGASVMRPNFKYFGASNSVLNEIYRTNVGDAIATPLTKVHDGHMTSFSVPGFTDFSTRYNVPEIDVDFEFRPVRKLWMDYTEDEWHVRVFALADQSQALTTDDPLELSNHKDYWQQSPWLYQYKPIQFFSDGSIKRGFYDDALSFLARDSAGNRLVLLRGISYEGDFGNTYLAATVAAPFTPWDEKFFAADNVPGAVRLKHQVTEPWMVGGVYTFRTGMIDNSAADVNQVVGVDTQYNISPAVTFKGEVAGSQRDQDLLTNDRIQANSDGYAYKSALVADFDHKVDGHTNFEFSYTQMDRHFNPNLSRYTSTRDDNFWDKHLTFRELSPDLEAFRIGDGIDTNRMVFRIRWKEQLFKERFENLFDVRNVHKTENTAYKETVLRNETTHRFNSQLTAKTLFRWHGLPKTTDDMEPFLSDFYFAGSLYSLLDPSGSLKNFDIPEGRDPSRFTYAGALQYIFNKEWTAEGFVEISNDLDSFPRGLLNDTFRDTNDRIDGLLIDHLTSFLYSQGPLGGIPPYEYHTTVKERLIYKPDDKVTIIFHATQNGYKFASGIDDNINHQGVSVSFDYSDKLNIFFDYTHSLQIDVPKLIATSLRESDFRDHHNFYASAQYKINPSQVLRAEYGVIGLGLDTPYLPLVTPYSATPFSLPTIDTEHLFRLSLEGEF